MMSSDTVEDGFNPNTDAFMAWLQQRPNTKVSPNIKVEDFRHCNAGRGIGTAIKTLSIIWSNASAVATAQIEVQEELFSIPQQNLLKVRNSNLQQLLPETLGNLDAWTSLILVMIYEDGLGPASAWSPYLRILPTELDTLVYWSSSELAELQGSAVLDKVGKASADASFKEKLFPILRRYPEHFGHYATSFSGPRANAAMLEVAHRMARYVSVHVSFSILSSPCLPCIIRSLLS